MRSSALREDVDDNIPLMFKLQLPSEERNEPEIDRYEVVYHGSISMSEDVNRQLEDLCKFNIDHPDDFRGHSMIGQRHRSLKGSR